MRLKQLSIETLTRKCFKANWFYRRRQKRRDFILFSFLNSISIKLETCACYHIKACKQDISKLWTLLVRLHTKSMFYHRSLPHEKKAGWVFIVYRFNGSFYVQNKGKLYHVWYQTNCRGIQSDFIKLLCASDYKLRNSHQCLQLRWTSKGSKNRLAISDKTWELWERKWEI